MKKYENLEKAHRANRLYYQRLEARYATARKHLEWERQRELFGHMLRLEFRLNAFLKQVGFQEVRFKYNPDQPRLPAGQTGGGEWTSEGDGNAKQPSIKMRFSLFGTMRNHDR